MPKTFDVRITTLDAELEFSVEKKCTGKELFDLIVRTLGVRETWYFGLQFEDKKGVGSWLKFNKRVLDQDVPKENPVSLNFRVKFYPEDAAEELMQEITQHLFFLQVKEAILNMDIFCPPEASVLLASYAVQAKYGDYDKEFHTPGFLANDLLLPQRVLDQYQMTSDMWEERITSWYAEHKEMRRDEAEVEYLKIAQDLEMYGVMYFEIKNRKGTDLWLGIDSRGLNIYEKENKLNPKISFPWNETKNISFHDRRFQIKPVDKSSPDFIFHASKLRVNKVILDLCVGNHELHMRRRKPDTMEIQQMRSLAREEKMRRQIDRDKLMKEKQTREDVVKQKEELERRMMEYQEEASRAKEALIKSEEMGELLAEKARVAEEEAVLLGKKASDAEEEIKRLRMCISRQSGDERIAVERRAREVAEERLKRVLQEAEVGKREALILKEDLMKSRQAERLAKQKLVEFTSSPDLFSRYSDPREIIADIDRSVNQLTDGEVNQLSREYERERNRNIQQQLKDLKTQMEGLKIDDRQTRWDHIHDENMRRGENKYSTLQKIQTETSTARIQFFEEL
ncbi:merlin-like isoform X1 [Montipora capricornis]|uniref:merlin-like isoform X1 n=1 Tax=Montipora foliosa TaxID=591990 RepID=UPI0035F1E51B